MSGYGVYDGYAIVGPFSTDDPGADARMLLAEAGDPEEEWEEPEEEYPEEAYEEVYLCATCGVCGHLDWTTHLDNAIDREAAEKYLEGKHKDCHEQLKFE